MSKRFPRLKRFVSTLACLALLVTLFPPGGIQTSHAASGVNIMPIMSGGMDMYISDTATRTALLQIDLFDEASATLNSVTINVDKDDNWQTFVPATDLALLSGDINAGLALYIDTNTNGVFDTGTDQLVGTQPTVWPSMVAGTDGAMDYWQLSFSDINQAISTTATAMTRLFVVGKAAAVDQDPIHSFMLRVPQSGIMTTGGGIGNFPSNWDMMFPPTWLGPVGSGGAGGMMGSFLAISEIQTAGGVVNDEFIELYNRDAMEGFDLTTHPISLAFLPSTTTDGYDFSDKTKWTTGGGGGAGAGVIDITSGTIPSNGFYLSAHTDYDGSPTENTTYTGFTLAESGGFVGLFEGTQLVDMVAYGNLTIPTLAEGGQPAPEPAANGSIERKAFPDSSSSKMTGIHASMGNGEDSQNNGMDFVLQTTSVPQAITSTAESMGGMGIGSSILINEVFYNTTTGLGWIELFNQSGGSVDLAAGSNWTIISNGDTYTFPESSTLNSGAYGVVYWNAAGTNTTTNFYTGNSGTTVDIDMAIFGGEIVVKDESGVIADYVQYGGVGFANEAGANSAGEWMAGDNVPTTLYGQSMGRRMNDPDYNGSGDWQAYSSPTPLTPNMGGDSTVPEAVSTVLLSDVDAVANSGIDGNDIRVVWTPSTTVDPTFDKYNIYILPATTIFDDSVHVPVDTIAGGQYQYTGTTPDSTFTYTGAPFITSDSAGSALATGSYKTYIVGVDFAGNKSGYSISAAATLTAETYVAGDDSQIPFIMHMGVWNAKAGVAMNIVARAVDDLALDGTNPLQLLYKVDAGAWQTAVECSAIDAGFYNCVIPSQSAGAAVSYYLKAKDAATTPNYSYFSASPTSDTSGVEDTVKTTPFVIDILDAATYYDDAATDVDLSGTIYKSDGTAFVDGQWPKLFIEGTAGGIITPANTTGAFTFPDNTLFQGGQDLVIFKDGYMDMMMNVFKEESVNIYMNEGTMNMTGGGDKPYVTWTAPGQGIMGAPTNIFCTGSCTSFGMGEMPIIIGFDKTMNENTINDQDASDAGSNIYLTTNGQDRVAGKVRYDSSMNEAIFYTTAADVLSPGTYYNIVVTQGVTDTEGNPIMGDGTGGSYMSGFTTMMDNTDMWGVGGADFSTFGGGGMMMPPYVMGTNPSPGSFSVPRNTAITVEFSEPMDSSSINSTNIKLYPITSEANWTVGTAVTATVTLDQATQRIATITPSSALDANAGNNGQYIIRVMGAVKSSLGIWMTDPSSCGETDPDTCLATQSTYESNFQVFAGATDSTAPTVQGTYPQDGDTGIDVGLPFIDIGFDEGMDSGTITAQNITLAVGSTSVSGSVQYDAMSKMAKFIPNNALSSNTQYTLTVGTGVDDLSGNALATAYSIGFTTGSADSTSPEVMYANGDDYSLAISFSEPMNAAPQSETNRWGGSVLNPANYFINGLDAEGSWAATPNLVAPYNTADGNALSGISNLNFTYDEGTMTVIIEGFAFAGSTPAFQVFIDDVKDKSGNIITDTTNRSASGTHRNSARGPLLNSDETFGMLGPGGGPGMMGGGGSGPMMDMGSMGMMMAGAFPMNAMAGQTSMYFIDVPTQKAIPSGGKIRLTFPSGFDVSSAAEDPYSPVNNDINEWNTGTITIASVTGTQASRTIDIVTGGGATQANDFLHMDIQGIVNSSIPKDFQTSGYTVDIKTFTADGALLESISTMPLFINEGGSRTVSGTITAAGATTGTMEMFLGSPMTGPMETSVNFATNGDGTAAYSFTSLPDGDYHIFTDPFVTLNSTNYIGRQMPEPIWVSGGDSTGNNFTLLAENAGTNATVTVTLTGDFSSGGINDNIDIFASSPNGFRVKTINPNTDDAAGGDTSLDTVQGDNITKYNLFLPAGDWMVGIGPAMPKGAMMGPPKMPDWMPPMPANFTSDGSTAGAVAISISGQVSKTITGTVQDGSAVGIADAEVYAYQPMGGFGGSNARTKADGTFTLKIPVLGTYAVGAFKPGLPHGQEQTINVQDNVSGVVFKMKKPGYTISGKVLNSQSQPVSYAPVWAYQTTGWGHADTMTDATGNYILYVDPGTWNVETDAPGVGWIQYERAVTVTDSDASNINLKPASDVTWRTISGTVGIDTDGTYSAVETALSNMPIRAVKYDATGKYLGQDYGGMTDSSGNYSLSVPSGIYRVDIWTPDYGERGVNNLDNDNILNEATQDDPYANNPANVNASAGDVSNADIIIVNSALKTITLQFTNGQASQEGFVDVEGVTFDGVIPTPTGFYRSFHVDDLSSSTTMQLEDGDYFFFLHVPTLGEIVPDSGNLDGTKKDIVVSANRNVQFTIPDLTGADVVTIDGTVSGPGAGQKNAWIWIGNPETGFHAGMESDNTTGAYSIKVPTLASGNYFVGADKPSFASSEPTSIAGTADATVDFTLATFDKTISGVIFADANSNETYDAGEEIPNGWAYAESSTGLKSFGPVDGTGAYSIGVVAGTWKVFGAGDGYSETQYPEELLVAGSSFTGKNIALSTDANWSNVQAAKPITPAQGGKLSDTGRADDGTASGTGVELTFPPNALGSSSSSGNVTAKATSSVSGTSNMDPIAGKAVNITAKDNSGQPITNLSDYVDLDMVIYKAEIENDGMQDLSKLKSMKIGYWDDTSNTWVYLETSRKAYYKDTADTEWTLYNGTETITGYEKFIDDALGTTPTFAEGTDYDDYKFLLKAKTNHFTVFAPGVAPDGLAPKAPTGLTQGSGSGTSVGLSWTAVTTNADDSAMSDLYGYAVYRSTDDVSYSQVSTSAILAGTETYTDSTTAAWTSYYYKITAGDDDNIESAYSTALQVCSNKTLSNGSISADCTITCDSGYTSSGNSCVSSGGGGGGGGGSSRNYRASSSSLSSYTLPTTRSIRVLDSIDPINLINSKGVFTRPVKLRNLYTKAIINFSKDTIVKDIDGNLFKGIITTPQAVVFSDLPTLPEGFKVEKAVETGASNETPLFFTKLFTLTIPLTKQFTNPENVKVFTYNTLEKKYELAGDGGQILDGNMVVEVDHMSYFIVLDTKGEDIITLFNEMSGETIIEEEEVIIYPEIERNVPRFAPTPAKMFTDTKGHWAADYIDDLRFRGVVQGKDEGIYDPDTGLSRSELTKIAVNAFSIPLEEDIEEVPFPDVVMDAWYVPYITTAKKYGIIGGYPNGFFRPDNSISRVEALKVILEMSGLDLSSEIENPYFDAQPDSWYEPYVLFATEHNMLTGNGNIFEPSRPITRAEMAKVIVKLWQMMMDTDDIME